jgi:dipeptide/tripeptide permease
MNAGNFPFIALFAFVAVSVLAPAISFVFLKRERDSIAEFSNRKPLASIFFTEILLWLAAMLVVGFVLVMVLGMFV